MPLRESSIFKRFHMAHTEYGVHVQLCSITVSAPPHFNIARRAIELQLQANP